MGHFETIGWKEAKIEIQKVNPYVVQLLDNVFRSEKNSKKTLYTAEYNYADNIVRDGVLTPPCNNDNCPICNKIISKYLSYSYLPIGISVDKKIEISQPIIPYKTDKKLGRSHSIYEYELALRVLNPGELFGVFEVADKLFEIPSDIPSWNLFAGVKSVHILLNVRNIYDKISEHFPSRHELPTDGDHEIYEKDNWRIIKSISINTLKKWVCKVIFIPEDWISGLSKEYLELQKYLLSLAWNQSRESRDYQIMIPKIHKYWESRRGLQKDVQSFMANLHYKLHSINKGISPAYVLFDPSKSNELEGPYSSTQDILFGIKNKKTEEYPAIIYLDHLSDLNNRAIWSISKYDGTAHNEIERSKIQILMAFQKYQLSEAAKEIGEIDATFYTRWSPKSKKKHSQYSSVIRESTKFKVEDLCMTSDYGDKKISLALQSKPFSTIALITKLKTNDIS